MIEWEEPFAWDNVDDKNLTVLKDLKFGFLSEGVYKINYTAIDSSGNTNECLINLTVKGLCLLLSHHIKLLNNFLLQ